MVYARTPYQKGADFGDKTFEQAVGAALGPYVIDNTLATDRLDWYVPGYLVEAKSKRQKLTARWHLLPGVPEEDLFIIDELSVRRAMKHGYEVFFALQDLPGNRLFFVALHELIGLTRVRVNRNTGGGLKGKWIINLAECRQIQSLDEIPDLACKILVETPWKASSCVSPSIEIPEV